MKSFKVDINTNQAEEILRDLFNEPVTQLSPIEMGELSKVFSFMVKNKPYVVHFRKSKESLDKAEYMYKAYGDKLPIPAVVMSGKIDEIYFNISNKAEGRPVSSYSVPEQKIILDDLAKHYTNMSQVVLASSKGFGLISPEGTAGSESWGEVIAGFFKENQEGFYKNWTNLYKESFLEKSLFEEGYLAMMELIKYSPNIPHLVHGDFHLGNMLSDGKQITGIVDWELSMHGDFMFDLAILHLWSPHLDFPQRIRKLWLENGSDIVNFEERLRSHMLFKAIDGLRFYAKQGARPSYDFIRERVVNLLKGL